MHQPMVTTSRRERRAQAAAQRRAHNKAVQHSCVLHRDCVEHGVAIEVDPQEFHPLHVARGEQHCPMCPVCQQRREMGKLPPKMNAATRDAMVAGWLAKLEWHRQAMGVAALLEFYGRCAKI